MVLLGGVGEAMILKWIGGKITSMVATHLAHASTAQVAQFAMHSANATITAVNSAASPGAAASALYHGAKFNFDVFSKMAVKREGLARQRDRSAASEPDFSGLSEEEIGQMLFAFAIAALATGYYAEQAHRGTDGELKTEMEEMEPCTFGSCSCKDYERTTRGSRATCMNCGHGESRHAKVRQNQLESGEAIGWLLESMALEVYRSMKNRDGEGQVKTELSQIDTCSYSSCPCYDFDLCEEKQLFSRRCSCGHRYRDHEVTGDWNWIIIALTRMVLAHLLSECE
jgi:hypothetical protein